jgi:immune inhibitor A
MNLIMIALMLMPPHPDVERMMKEENTWEKYVQILEDARKRGLDAPSEELMDKTFREVQTAKAGKQKVMKRAVVILCDFSDNVGTTPPIHYDSLTNSIGIYPSGSVREYYQEVSYGLIDVDFVITPVWVRLPNPYTYYTNNQYGMGAWPQNAQRMAYDAVLAADPYIDFSQCDLDSDGVIDALVIIHAGPGAESTGNLNHIWSHAWVIPVNLYVDGVRAYHYTTDPENAGCGVISHELGHRPFGLPDLYDTDNSSEGLGNWCLMAAGSWNGNGAVPAHMSPWCKIRLGLVTVDTVRTNRIYQPIPAVEDSPIVYRLWTNGTTGNKFFVVENRRLKKFDRALPSQGLLIYHIDNTRNNNNNEWYPGQNYLYHYMVALEQADGRWDLEHGTNRGDAGDPWPGTSNNRDFHNYSVPDSKDYGNPMITTYVGVLNISDPADIAYADLMVSPYNNLKLSAVSIPRADTTSASSEFNVRIFNNGFSQRTVSLNFLVYDESANLVYDTTVSGITVDTGFANTVTLVFQPNLDDCEYSYTLVAVTGDDVARDDSMFGYYYAKSIVRNYDVARAEGDNFYYNHVVDGVIDDYEYFGASWIDISNFLGANGDYHRTIRNTYMKAHILRDTLYLGFMIVGDSTVQSNDYITLVVDDNGDGAFPASNSNEGEISFRDGTPRLSYFRPYTATGTGSMQTLTLPQGHSVAGNTKYSEVAVPIGLNGSGQAYYLNLPGDYTTFGPRFFVKVTDGARIVGWWPQNIEYATTVRDLANFATLSSTPVNVTEGQLPLRVSAMWRGTNFILKYMGAKEGSEIRVSVYNALGRRVKMENYRVYGSGELRISMSDFASGVYFVNVNVDGRELQIFKGVLIK